MAYNYCNEYPERRQQDVGQEITCNQTFENTDGLSIFGRLQQIDNQDKGTGKSRLSVYLDRIYSTDNGPSYLISNDSQVMLYIRRLDR